jgi:hypothetical protein
MRFATALDVSAAQRMVPNLTIRKEKLALAK